MNQEEKKQDIIVKLKDIIADTLLIIPTERWSFNKLDLDFKFEQINYESVIEVLTRIRDLENYHLRDIPESKIIELTNYIEIFNRIFKKGMEFKLRNYENPLIEIDSIIDEFNKTYEAFTTLASFIISYINNFSNQGYISIDDPDIENVELEKLKIAALKSFKEIERLKESSRSAASAVGAYSYSKIFDTQAKANNKESIFWLIVTAILVGFGINFLFNLINNFTPFITSIPKELPINYVLIQYGLTRLLIISIILLAIRFSISNYKSSKHNSIINYHRHNALQTFEVFYYSTKEDKEAQNAVLAEATKTIFAHNVSGYLKSEPDPSSSIKFIEIIQRVADTK